MSDVKLIINKVSSWERSTSFNNKSRDSITDRIEKSLAAWKHDELENGKLIVILNANTTVLKMEGGEEEWILTITYDYKLIVKREILLEKLKQEVVQKLPEFVQINDMYGEEYEVFR